MLRLVEAFLTFFQQSPSLILRDDRYSHSQIVSMTGIDSFSRAVVWLTHVRLNF